jgi:hypothetical protein
MSESPMSSPAAGSSRQGGEKSGIKPEAAANSGNWKWNLLLLLPYIALLWLPFYAKGEPRLGGFPFFYWYQFLWVFLTMFFIELVYRRTR